MSNKLSGKYGLNSYYFWVILAVIGPHAFSHYWAGDRQQIVLAHLFPALIVFLAGFGVQRRSSIATLADGSSPSDRNRPSDLESAAEDIYFLAYMATLVGLVSLGTRVFLRPTLLDEADLLLGEGGLNIVATLAGVLWMQRFRNLGRAQRRKEEESREEQLAREQTQLQSVLEALVNKLKLHEDERLTALSHTLSHAISDRLVESDAARFEKLQEMYKPSHVGQITSQLLDQLSHSKAAMEELNRAAGSLSQASSSLNTRVASLDNALSNLGKVGEGLQNQWQIIDQHVTAAGCFGEVTSRAITAMEQLANNMRTAPAEISQFLTNLSSLKTQVESSLASLHTGSSNLQDFHQNASQFAELASRVMAPLRQVADNFREVENLKQNMEALVGSVSNFQIVVERANLGINNFTGAQNEVRGVVSDFITELQSNLHKLQQLQSAIPPLETLAVGINNALIPLGNAAGDIQQLRNSLSRVMTTDVQGLRDKLSEIVDTLGSLNTATSAAAPDITNLKKSVAELREVISEFVQFTEEVIEGGRLRARAR